MNQLTIELTCPDPAAALQDLERADISIQDAQTCDQFTLRFMIHRRQQTTLARLARRRGYAYKVQSQRGWHRILAGTLRRPVLMLGLLCLIFLSVWVPGRIFFIQVEGNSAVPTARILEAAAQCGVSFGASMRQVRSQQVKNALLASIPSLKWAGVNTHGCVAIISVGEADTPSAESADQTVGSIIAGCDGVIRELIVLQGTALCAPGQAVLAGQTLISAYTDCGICLRADRAQGDVWAYTNRVLTVIAPTKCLQQGEIQRIGKKYSLIIGKKRINFANSSGILGSTCARIYSEYYIALPGGFQLPLAVAVETCVYRSQETVCLASAPHLQEASAAYLRTQIQGSILKEHTAFTAAEEFMQLRGVYSCLEMIGRFRPEENLPNYEND